MEVEVQRTAREREKLPAVLRAGERRRQGVRSSQSSMPDAILKQDHLRGSPCQFLIAHVDQPPREIRNQSLNSFVCS